MDALSLSQRRGVGLLRPRARSTRFWCSPALPPAKMQTLVHIPKGSADFPTSSHGERRGQGKVSLSRRRGALAPTGRVFARPTRYPIPLAEFCGDWVLTSQRSEPEIRLELRADRGSPNPRTCSLIPPERTPRLRRRSLINGMGYLILDLLVEATSCAARRSPNATSAGGRGARASQAVTHVGDACAVRAVVATRQPSSM